MLELTAEEREWMSEMYNERAAIMEYDGELSKGEAEKLALDETLNALCRRREMTQNVLAS